jgi:hypothetical protein
MLSPLLQRRLTLLLIVAIITALLAWLWWQASGSKNGQFLVDYAPAHWIRYPAVPQSRAWLAATHTTIFCRAFTLDAVPTDASLKLRAFRSCRLRINNTDVPLPGHDTKNMGSVPIVCDIAPWLQRGENSLSVAVTNSVGPPSLWLLLVGGDVSVVSDSSWQASLDGAALEPAYPASMPMLIGPGSMFSTTERTWTAWRTCTPVLALIMIASAGVVAAWQLAERRGVRFFGGRASIVICGIVGAGLWGALFLNNLTALVFPIGFDYPSHLEYIDYIQKHMHIPLAGEGWKTDQPPLYYVVAALLFNLCGFRVSDYGALFLVRVLGFVIGLIQLALVFAGLRLLFPDQPRRALLGVLLLAFVPMHLYLSHHVTNATMAAMWSTAAIFLCLSILRTEQPSLWRYVGLGLCLGAGLLTQITMVAVYCTPSVNRERAGSRRSAMECADTFDLAIGA